MIANLPPYDEGDVQELKRELLDSIGNAANIRNLKPENWITIAVNSPARLAGELIQVTRGEEPDKRERSERPTQAGQAGASVKMMDIFSVGDADTSSESTMILRVRKSDLDALAKKNVAPGEFSGELEKLVTVQIY